MEFEDRIILLALINGIRVNDQLIKDLTWEDGDLTDKNGKTYDTDDYGFYWTIDGHETIKHESGIGLLIKYIHGHTVYGENEYGNSQIVSGVCYNPAIKSFIVCDDCGNDYYPSELTTTTYRE